MAKTRGCGSCNACCIAPSIVELAKGEFQACKHLRPGHQGCTVYEDRPESCRTFACGWINTEEMPSRFRPDRCGMMTMVMKLPDGSRGISVFEISAEYEGSRLQRWLEPKISMPLKVVKRVHTRRQRDRVRG